MVIRSSMIIPELNLVCFRCFHCENEHISQLLNGIVEEPKICEVCEARGSYQMINNRCKFLNKQIIRLQEAPEEIPEGETPQSIMVHVFQDQTDAVRPGDRIEVTGILKATAKRINPRQRACMAVFRTHLEAIHFRAADDNAEENIETRVTTNTNLRNTLNQNEEDSVDDLFNFGEDRNNSINNNENHNDNNDSNLNNRNNPISSSLASRKFFSRERVEEIKALSRDSNIYNILTNAIAPSIWEMDDAKRGVLALLFGGVDKRINGRRDEFFKVKHQLREDILDALQPEDRSDPEEFPLSDATAMDNVNCRGDINVLLCGDPGTSKSQLLLKVHKLSPRGIYTSGKGSSAVGLTASVVRDPETKEVILESGALVLSDHGICCIDEFDKMSDTTRAILHEAMEQQTVSVAKAGIICTLNARTSILASANPVESRYNPRLSVVENIRLPPTLLSRFDLIYLILDKPTPENDRRLAKHLVSLYCADAGNIYRDTTVSQELLKDYIAFARLYCHPKLSKSATSELVEGYLSLRRAGSIGGSKTITATPRQLESLIRLSEALARMRLAAFVTREDVKEAIRLMKVATQTAAMDPTTGTIDMSIITTGRATGDRDLQNLLLEHVEMYINSHRGERVSLEQIRAAIHNAGEQLKRGNNHTNENRNESSNNVDLTEARTQDVAQVIRKLAEDGVVQFFPHSSTVIVKD